MHKTKKSDAKVRIFCHLSKFPSRKLANIDNNFYLCT